MAAGTVILLFLVFSISVTNSARILAYYPTPSISHQVVFRPLTNELVKRGHQVTVVTADPEYTKGQAPTNLTEVDVHDLSYRIWKEKFISRPVGVKMDASSQIAAVFATMNEVLEKQFQTTEVRKVIDKNNKYDLMIIEGFDRGLLVLSHLFKIPVIKFSSMGLVLDNYQQFGVAQHELLHPTYFRRKLYNLTVWEKITELYGWYKVVDFYNKFEEEEYAMIKRNFGEDVPPFSELAKNLDMIFLNSHPMFEGVWPMPPNVIHIYGIHKKPVKEIPTDLKRYLDSSENGVIYISFGTNVQPSLLPPEKIQILIKVVSDLPYDVLWKWDKDEMENKSKNIKLTKWVPQSDLLKHPKIKLFITQGGLQSTDEAIEAGVPLIGIPLLGDQWFNVAQIVYHKIGLRLEMETLDVDSTRKAVKTVLSDSSFRVNMARLKSIMHDQPETPLERAVWWTEYVIRNKGAKHLRSPSANMDWVEYFEVELIAVILAGVVGSITVAIMVVLALCKMVCKKDSKTKKRKTH